MAVPILRRILLIEDDPDIQVVASLSLTSLGGFTVKVCGSGAEAVAAVPRFRPHLILLDVMMPGMDGPGGVCGVGNASQLLSIYQLSGEAALRLK